jgi:hypothetical protein
MRRTIVLSTLAILALSSAAVAGDNSIPVQTASMTGQAPVIQVAQTRARGGLFSRIMELERRKNAWLRRTFGR